MWTVRSLSTSAAAASRASAAASTLPSARPSARPSAGSRKPLALSLGIALYAVALVLWWLTLRDGAAPLGRLQLLVSREDSVDAPSAPASAPAATPAAASSTPSTVRTPPVDPSTIVVPRYKCLGWRQTGDCSPDGPREPEHDLKCGTLLSGGLSGYCALEDLATGQEVVSLRANCSTVRGDVKFKCSQVADMAHMRYELDKVVAQAKWDEFHRQQAQVQLRVAEAQPANGIVMVVYPKLLVSVHATVRLLRSLGCELPIELWYLENELGREPETRPIVQSLLSEFGPIKLRGVTDGRVLGFAAKVYAIANSDFDQVLFLDADNTPVRDPTFLFTDSKAFRTTGAVFWPDFWHPRSTIFNIHEHSPLWEMVGTPFVDMFEQESGQILIDKRRAKASGALAALEYLAYHEPNHFANYKFLHGDKDLFRLAWMKSETPFHMVAHPAAATGFMKNPKFGGGSFCGMTMAQFDPDARADAGPDAVLFLHRNAKKLTGTEDEEKDRLWTHIQTFAFPDGVADDAEAYRILSEHYKIGIRGLPSKMARTSMCYGGQDKKHFKLTPMTELAWNVTGLETSLLQFAKEAAKIGTASP